VVKLYVCVAVNSGTDQWVLTYFMRQPLDPLSRRRVRRSSMQHPVEGLVAKTESYRPANFANLQAWQKSGVVSTVKWYTAEDDRVCPQWLKNFYGDCKRAKKPFQAVLHFREARSPSAVPYWSGYIVPGAARRDCYRTRFF
jgi:hypothetical protein